MASAYPTLRTEAPISEEEGYLLKRCRALAVLLRKVQFPWFECLLHLRYRPPHCDICDVER